MSRLKALRWFLAAAALTALLLASSAAPAALEAGLPYLLPFALLLLALARRRYPGDRILLAFVGRRRRRLRRRPIALPAPPRALRALLPRGGRLLACSLAVRPPPQLASSPTC
jgi:hypothetical protein